MLALIGLPGALRAEQVTIGDESSTSSSYLMPVNMNFNYSMTQQIYTADEINMPQGGTITSISLEYVYSGSFSLSGVQVYMKNISKSGFENNNDWVEVSETDKVWQGTFAASGAGWVTLNLNSVFHYDGTSNLLVCFYKPTTGYPGTVYKFRTTSTSTDYPGQYLALTCNHDNYIPDLNDIYSYSGAKGLQTVRNNIRLNINPDITEVYINDFTIPAWEENPDYDWSVPSGVNYYINAHSIWKDETLGSTLYPGNIFNQEGHDYVATFYFSCIFGYHFSDNATVYLNGDPLLIDEWGTDETGHFARTIPFHVHPGYTVNDGSATSEFIPVSGYWADTYLKTEFVMPSSSLADLSNTNITGMTFYSTSDYQNVSWSGAHFLVFMKEVGNTTIDSYTGYSDATVVYEGDLSIVDGLMNIPFTTPYAYNGGNLLIGVYNTATGNYNSCSWVGVYAEGASINGYSYNSLDNVSANQMDFLPKTTFSYEISHIDFENKDISDYDFANDATYPWIRVDAANGCDNGSAYCMRSGNAGVAYSSSTIQITHNFPSGGSISFDAKCMGEGTSTFWDHCDFLIDGAQIFTHGADISDWQNYMITVTPGSHTFTWTYTKDGSVNPTGDGFFVDNIEFNYQLPCVAPNNLIVEQTDNTHFTVSWDPVTGAPGYDVEIAGMTIPFTVTETYTTVESSFPENVSQMVRVRTHCNGSNVSDWAETTFTPMIIHSTANWYGFALELADDQPWQNHFVHFTMQDPATVTQASSDLGHYYTFGAAYANGYVWCLNGDGDLVRATLDNTNHIISGFETIVSGMENNCMSMSYNPNNGLIYYINTSLQLLSFSPDDPENTLTTVGSFSYLDITSLAINQAGEAYCVDNNGFLYQLNLNNASVTSVGNTGLGSVYVQSLAFDLETNELFWSERHDNSVGFYKVDPATAKVAFLGQIGGGDGCQLVGLFMGGDATPICPAPTNLYVDGLTSDNAILHWTENGSATAWSVRIATTSDLSDDIFYDATAQSYDFSHSLTPGTTYYVEVQSSCEGGWSSVFSSVLTFTTPSGTTEPLVEIGSCSTGSSYLPSYSYYNYSLTQQIYTAAEVGQAGDISSVSFFNNGSTKTRIYDVYLVHTDKSAFSGSTDWVPVTAADRVFSGAVNMEAGGWTTLEFDNMFHYNGTQNLLLVVDDNTESYSSGMSCFAFDAESQALRIFSDGIDYDPYDPSTYTGTLMNVKNCVQFTFGPILCHKPTNLTVSNIGKTSATLNWTENGTATEWQVCVNGDEAGAITVTTTPYTLTGLTAETEYTVKVRANCGGSDGVSAWSAIKTFTTLPSCFAPTNLTVSNVTQNTAILEWTENDEATEWEICVNGDEANPITVTTNPYTLTGLTPNMTHTVKVRANCGGSYGVSAWTGSQTFTTISDYVVQSTGNWYGYVYNGGGAWNNKFVNFSMSNPSAVAEATVSEFPSTWSAAYAKGYVWFITEGGDLCRATLNNSSKTISAYETIIPGFEGSYARPMAYNPANEKMYYMVKPADDAPTRQLKCFDPSNPNLVTEVGTIGFVAQVIAIDGTGQAYCIEYTTGDLYRVNLTDASHELIGSTGVSVSYPQSMAFDNNTGELFWAQYFSPSDNGLYVVNPFDASTDLIGHLGNFDDVRLTGLFMGDDFVITCPAPSDLSVSNVGPHTADFSWTGSAGSDQWECQYSTSADFSSSALSVTVNEPSAQLTGLTPETTYYVRVRTLCGTMGNSYWSNTESFTTEEACPVPSDLSASNITANSADVSWTGFGESYDLRYVPGNQLRYDNGIYENSWGYGSGATVTWATMYPASMLGSNSTLTDVSIYEDAGYNTENITIEIYSGGDDAPGTLLYSEVVTPQGSTGFHEITLSSPVTFDPSQNLWISLTEYGTYVICSCDTNESELNCRWINDGGTWQDVSAMTGDYTICWMIRATIDNGDAWTTLSGITSPAHVSGLDPETTYMVQVQSDCGVDGTSGWSNSAFFTTTEPCPAPYDLAASDITGSSANLSWTGFGETYTVRYRQRSVFFSDDFENGLGQWTQIDADGDGYIWRLGSDLMGTSFSAHGGTDIVTSQSYDNYSGALYPDNYLVTPQITLGGTVEFWAKAQDPSYPSEHFGIAVSTTGNTDPSDFQTVPGAEWTLTSGDWQQFVVDLSAYAGQQGYVALRHHDCTDMYYLDIDDFIIYDPTVPWTTVTSNSSSFTLNGLDSETSYEFQVQSDCGSDGMSGWSNTGSFTTTTASACPAPTNLTVVNIGSNGAGVSWNQPDGGDHWIVQYSTNPDFSNSSEDPVVSTSWYIYGLTPSTTYYVRVSNDCGSDGISAWSNAETFTTTESPCIAPTNLTVSSISYNGAELTWDQPGGGFDWLIEYSTTPDFSSSTFVNSFDTYWSLTELNPITTYYVRVANDCGTLGASEWVTTSFTTTGGVIVIPDIIDFETQDISDYDFVNDGTYPWIRVNAANGCDNGSAYCMRSGNAGVPSSTSTIEITHNYSADGYITFDAKCMGEGVEYDVCEFLIDGVQQFSRGEDIVGWQPYAFPVTAGNHTFTWKYTKDSSVDPTGDGFFVDNIEFGTGELCITPSNLAATSAIDGSATVSWDGYSSSYTLRYRPEGGAWTTVPGITGLTCTITGLPIGNYEVVLTPDCDPTSFISGTFSIMDVLSTANWYGYGDYSDASWHSKFITFSMQNPATVAEANPSYFPSLYAAAYANGYVCFITESGDLCRATLDNNSRTISSYETVVSEFVTTDYALAMSYNPVDGQFYYINGTGDNPRRLMRFDLANPSVVTEIGTMSVVAQTMAINNAGEGYCIERNTGNLYRLNLADASTILVGSTGHNSYYVQGLAFDLQTGELFWAQYYSDSDNALYKVDPTTAQTHLLGHIGNSSYVELTGLFVVNDATPTCPAPTNLYVDGLTSDNAILHWTENGSATSWSVGIATTLEGLSSADYHNATTQSYDFSHTLVPGTTYYAAVQSNCGGGLHSILSMVTFTTPSGSEPDPLVEIGSGNGAYEFLPTYIFYSYTLSQQIYTAAEIGQAGDIYSVAFYNFSSDATRAIDVYMVHTDKSAFSGGYDWTAVTSADLVFSGNVDFLSNEWSVLEFSTPFHYNGTDNLLLVVDDNTGDYENSRYFKSFDAAGQAMRIYSDFTNFDPSNPSGYAGTVVNAKNQIQLGFAPILCHKPSELAVSNITQTSATLNWTENDAATEWQICVNGDETNAIPATTNPYTLTGLTPNTTYTVKVRANCGGSNGVSLWCKETTFTTISDYEIQSTGNWYAFAYNSGASPAYLKKYVSFSMGNPSVVTGASTYSINDGVLSAACVNGYVWFTTYNNSKKLYRAPLDNVHKTLGAYETLDPNFIESEYGFVYCMSYNPVDQYIYYVVRDNSISYLKKFNPEDPVSISIGTFPMYYPVAFAVNSSGVGYCVDENSNFYQVNLNDATATLIANTGLTIDGYRQSMVFDLQTDELFWSQCGGVGDIGLYRVNPATADLNYLGQIGDGVTQFLGLFQGTDAATCPAPTNLTVSNIEAHFAELTWTENGDATSWDYQIDTDPGFPNGFANQYNVTDNPILLGSLTPETTYYVRVRSYCGGEAGDSYWSAPVIFTTPEACPTPTNVAVESQNTIAIISWTENGEATEWQICINDDETNAITVTTNPYTLTGLTLGTDYTVKVRANCGGSDGDSYWSSTIGFSTYSCEAPTVLTADAIPNSAYLSWDGHSDSYELLYRLVGETTWISMDNIHTNGYTLHGLTPGEYEAQVSSLCDPSTWVSTTFTIIEVQSTANWYGFSTSDMDDVNAYKFISFTMDNPGTVTAATGTLASGFGRGSAYANGYLWNLTNDGDLTKATVDNENKVISAFETVVSELETSGSPLSMSYNSVDGRMYYIIWNNESLKSFDPAQPDNVTTVGELGFEPVTIAINNLGEAYCIAKGSGDLYQVNLNNASVTLVGNTGHLTNYAQSMAFDYQTGELFWAQHYSFGYDNYGLYKVNPATAETYYLGRIGGGNVELTSLFMVNDETPCPAPTDLAVETVGIGDAVLSWTSGESYNLRFREEEGEWTYVEGVSSPYYITGLSANTDYEAQAQFDCGSSGLSAWGNLVSFTTLPCPAPTDLTVSNITLTSALLDWNQSGGGYEWDVEFSTSPDFTPSTIEWVISSSYPMADLTPGTTYYVRVQSICPMSIPGGWSDVVTFTTEECPAPTNVTVSNVTGTSAEISWTSVGADYEWDIEYSTDPSFATFDIEWAISTNWTLSGLDPGTTYYVRVKSTCYDHIDGGTSPAVSFTTETPFCPAPTSLAVSNVTNHTAELSWTENGSAVIWYVMVNGDEAHAMEITDNPFTMYGLTPETAYTVAVRSDCGDGMYSDWSNTVSFTTAEPCSAPTDLTAISVGATSATIGWTSGGNYLLRYRASSGSWVEVGEEAVPSPYTIPGLQTNTTYEVQAMADCGTDGMSTWGTSVSFTTESCGVPTDLEVVAVTANSITISWASGLPYNVRYRRMDGTDIWHNTTNKIPPYTITGLLPDNEYRVQVQDVCATGGNSSTYSTAVVVTTLACVTPDDVTISDITSDGATVSWTTGNSCNLRYREAGGEWTEVTGVTSPYALTGLHPNGAYELMAQNDCGTDGLSGWSDVEAFTTAPCDPQAVPYAYDFETQDPYYCWRPVAGNVVRNHVSASTYNHTTGGEYALAFFESASDLVALPQFAQETNGLQVMFWLRPQNNVFSGHGTFEVGYLTDVADATTFTAVSTYSYDDWASNGYVRKIVTFPGAPAGSTIAFRHNSPTANGIWYVDDILVSAVCPMPENIIVTNVTNSSATVTWTDNGAASWDVSLVDLDAYAYNTTTNQYTLTGLNAGATYNIKVRSNCGDGVVSDWSEKVYFTMSTNVVPSYATITGESSVCQSHVTLLTAHTDVPATYLWSIGATTQQITAGPGTYWVKVTSSTGDQLVSETFTVAEKPNFAVTESRSICPDEMPYTWNGFTFTLPGSQAVTLTASNGCDSVVTMILSLNPTYNTPVSATICQGGSYDFFGETLTVANTYTHTLQSQAGCDSVITLTLTVNPTYAVTDEATICPSQLPYEWNGVTFNAADTKTATLQTANGCDSVVTMTLHVNPEYTTPVSATICQGESYDFFGETLTAANTYTHTLHTVNGCDSVIVLTLTVNPTFAMTDEATICPSQLPYEWNGVTFNSADTKTATLQTVNGCDSVVTMTLHVNPEYTTPVSATICQGESYDFFGQTLTAANTYTHTLHTVNGCDSVIVLTLTVNPSYAVSEQRTVCPAAMPYHWNEVTFTAPGTKFVTLQTVAGCDSVVTMTLAVADAFEMMETREVCVNELPYVWNGKTFYSAGTKYATLTASNGCDSVVTMVLVVNTPVNETFTVSACGNYTWIDGVTYTTSGNHTYSHEDAHGCTQVDTLHLTIYNPVHTAITVEACGSYTWTEGDGQTYTTSGDRTYSHEDAHGCTQVDTLHLTINNPVHQVYTVETCGSYTWTEGDGQIYTTSGDRIYSHEDSHGCTQVDTLHLTIYNPVHTAVTVEACGSYTWTEGDGQTYTTSGDRTYSHEDTHGCTQVDTLHLTIHNPVHTAVTVDASGSYTWTEGDGQTYTTSGDRTYSHEDIHGCTQVDTLHLTVYNPVHQAYTEEVCGSYTWIDGVTYTTSGDHTYTHEDAHGCTQVDTLHLTVYNPVHTAITVTECGSYEWNGHTYTTSGDYTFSHEDAHGCTQVDTLHLTIFTPVNTAITVEECGSYTWTAGNNLTYTTSGDYTYSHTDANGCTQVDTLHLTIFTPANTSLTVTECGSYTWNGLTYTTSGDFIYSHADAHGCTQVDTLHLTILQPTHTAVTVTECGSYTWAANGQTYTASGNYTYSHPDANGCTQVDTLHLTIHPTYNVPVNIDLCQGESYSFFGQTLNQTGVYTHTMQTDAGCDSVVTLNLTVHPFLFSAMADTICEGTTYNFFGQTLSTPGVYAHTLQSQYGCDSLVTLSLTVNPVPHTDITAEECGSYLWNGNTYTESGNYPLTLTAANGCDSVVTLHLTIHNPVNTAVTVSECGSYTWAANNQTYTVSGDYTYSHTDGNGCTQVDTLHLTIHNPVHTAITAEGCGSYTWNGQTYTASGDYTYSHADGNGCTQVDTLHLTISTPAQTDLYETACGSYTWNGQSYTTSGNFAVTLTAANGCDSVVTLHLTITTPAQTDLYETACGSYTWNGQTYTTTGNYSVTYTAANGCDSVVTLHLTINQSLQTDLYETACGSYTWNGQTYTESNDYAMTFTSVNGCDSLVVLHLTINQSVQTDLYETACDSYTWVDGNTYTLSDDYAMTLTAANGCDSLVVLHLTINNSTASEFTIETPDSCYTWNGQTYCASGDYVQTLQTVNGCDSVVTLHLTTSVGVENHEVTFVFLAPNPTKNICRIMGLETDPVSVEIFDMRGKLLMLDDDTDLDVSVLPTGMYTVRVNTGDRMLNLKLIKQ